MIIIQSSYQRVQHMCFHSCEKFGEILTCTNNKFPIIIVKSFPYVFIFPKLAWVDNLDARHISRFPFRPKRAGIKTNKALTSWKTVYFCNNKHNFSGYFCKNSNNYFFRYKYQRKGILDFISYLLFIYLNIYLLLSNTYLMGY